MAVVVNVPESKGILKMRAQLAGSVSVWRRVVVLSLCVCLLAAASAQAAENQVLSVRASETELLRDLLSGKRINASFTDGTRLEGRVKEIQEALLRVDIKKTSDPNSVPRGLQEIPTDRTLTVKFTRYQGNKRLLLGTLGTLGGVGLGGGVATATRGDRSGGAYLTVVIIGIGVGALGYLWGKKKDKKNVTLVIQQPEASGGGC